MKKFILKLMFALVVLSSVSVVFNGCASSNYSKGFDEAD